MREMEKASYVISLKRAPVMKQIKSLETTILTGLYSEKIMMVQSATLLRHSILPHSHPHEQISARAQHGPTCSGVEPFVMLDIFYPVGKDFVQKPSEQTTVIGNDLQSARM